MNFTVNVVGSIIPMRFHFSMNGCCCTVLAAVSGLLNGFCCRLQMLECVSSLIKTDRSVSVRQAAALFTYQLLSGLGTDSLKVRLVL